MQKTYLEFRIKLGEVSGFDVENIAEVTKVAEDGLESVGRAELVKDVCSQSRVRRHWRLAAQVLHLLLYLSTQHITTNPTMSTAKYSGFTNDQVLGHYILWWFIMVRKMLYDHQELSILRITSLRNINVSLYHCKMNIK